MVLLGQVQAWQSDPQTYHLKSWFLLKCLEHISLRYDQTILELCNFYTKEIIHQVSKILSRIVEQNIVLVGQHTIRWINPWDNDGKIENDQNHYVSFEIVGWQSETA